jgi:hypothetical protein
LKSEIIYTAAEYAEMLILYGKCGRNAREDARDMQYVFLDVCHIQIITYFYGWYIVLETLGPWCLPNKKLMVPREKLGHQRLKMLFFSPLMTVEEVNIFEELYLPRTYQYLNDRIHEALATVIPNMLRLARENLIKRARLFLQMKGGHFEHLL